MQNKDIATRLGVHPVTLARLRSGHRRPSVDLIHTINKKLGWSVVKQIEAYQDDDKLRYASEFRRFLEDRYDIPDRKDS